MIDVLKPLIQQFMPFAKEKMGFDRPPKLFLRQDRQNADNPMGKTGFYDPQKESITLYITDRHPKDIMRSLAHELQHHTQKCNGDFDNVTTMGEQGYAQADPHMRTMEIQAYQASIVFRDWEDSTKGTIYYEHLQKGDNVSMSTKDWKNGELKSLLSEAWGFKMDLSKLNEKKELEELATGRGYDTEAPRKPRRISGGRGEEEDCDARTDPTCVPEPGPKAVASSIADRMKKKDLNEMCPDMDPDMDAEEATAMDHEAGGDMSVEDKAMLAMKAVHDLASAAGVELSSQVDLSGGLAEDPPGMRYETVVRRRHTNRMYEVVQKLHKAGFTTNQIKESLTNAFKKAQKG